MSYPFIQIIFAKPPIPGKVKTRLAKFTGDTAAKEIYESLLSGLITHFLKSKIKIQIWSETKKNINLLYDLLPTHSQINIQKKTDLGGRMAHAIISTAKKHPKKNILLCGSDIPDYNTNLAIKAAKILETTDMVLGPAIDGGYYLIGFSATIASNANLVRSIFSSMEWSHKDVYNHQVKRIISNGLSYDNIRSLHDLDTAQDYTTLSIKHKRKFKKFLPDIRVIIPVLNEATNLEHVIKPLKESGLFKEIICADNGSTDGSLELAQSLGAYTTLCQKKGYGATCLTAIQSIKDRGGCDIILFMDADGSDNPIDLITVLAPVVSDTHHISIGKRVTSLAQKGALKPHQIFGNALAVVLIRLFFFYKYCDLGPMRAIRFNSLLALEMDDLNFGWTIQMQIRCVIKKLKIIEPPVHYMNRHSGKSKVTATLLGSIQAGYIIIKTVFKERLFPK